ncbi:ribonuclease H-like domain-containing protein [Tanacetum coccineum]
MVTRFCVGTNRPTKRLNLLVSLVSHLPKSFRDAFSDPNWQNTMRDEYHALIKNKTWTLVPRPPDTNIVHCMWLFRHKYLADGTLSRYKARLVANGSTYLAASQHWLIHQLDVKNDFLHGDLSEIVYTHQPPRFRDFVHPDYKYVVKILEKAHMVNCNPSLTPVDTESKLGVDGDPVSDSTLYRSLAGSLQYLTFTRPDISYAVQQVCLHMHDPWEPYLSALKRILRYVRGTLHYGLQLFSSSTTDLVAYSDTDWAGCPTTQRSTSGYYVFLGNNLLSWSSKCQPTLSRSRAEADNAINKRFIPSYMWLLEVEFDGIVDVDETLLERALKFKDEIEFSLKLMNEMVQVCDISNIVQQKSVSNQQGRPQDDDEKMTEPKSSVDLDLCDIQHHDTEEPQKETNEDDSSQEDVENPEGLRDEQSPPKVIDTVRDPESSADVESNKRDQEYALQFPSLHQSEESTPPRNTK